MKKDYEGQGITVHWDSDRCIHTGICIKALPTVFDTSARPWINVEGGTTQQIADAVARCPTGALRFTSDIVREKPAATTVLRPVRGGPMIVRGNVEVVGHDGEVLCTETRVALCRCGNSGNQPFCDNSHRTKGFAEPELKAPEPVEAPDEVCPPQAGFEDQ